MSARPAGRPIARTILVVDDDTETVHMLRALLEREGHRVLTAESGAAALSQIGREPIALALIDYAMPEMDGGELSLRIREREALVQIILQTEKPPRQMLRMLGIHGFHDRRDGAERLLLAVDVALKVYDQLAELHAAERLKTEMLANVSHELRTPLNVIVGYLGLVREGTFGDCPAEANAVLDKVLGNASYLLELLGEFLDFSKLEAVTAGGQRERIALTPFLHELAESSALLVRTKPVTFTVDIPANLPVVLVEGAKLRVVMQNLLSNAEKFTEQGTIGIAATMPVAGRVAIRVSDTGPGIAPEHHQAIFDIFHQLRPREGKAQAHPGGVGLGLALARRFARMMGGDVTVESAVGEGSTFTLVLPVAGPGARRDATS